jgi:hypothetical protein
MTTDPLTWRAEGVTVVCSEGGGVSIRDVDGNAISLTPKQAARLFRTTGPAVLYEIDRRLLRKAPGSG